MACQLMHTRALLDVPHTNGAIQRAGDDVLAIKLVKGACFSATKKRAMTYDKRVHAIGVAFERV